jgi:hypothetical protein
MKRLALVSRFSLFPLLLLLGALVPLLAGCPEEKPADTADAAGAPGASAAPLAHSAMPSSASAAPLPSSTPLAPLDAAPPPDPASALDAGRADAAVKSDAGKPKK